MKSKEGSEGIKRSGMTPPPPTKAKYFSFRPSIEQKKSLIVDNISKGALNGPLTRVKPKRGRNNS